MKQWLLPHNSFAADLILREPAKCRMTADSRYHSLNYVLRHPLTEYHGKDDAPDSIVNRAGRYIDFEGDSLLAEAVSFQSKLYPYSMEVKIL